MSENKCQFHVGDMVSILPFDSLLETHRDVHTTDAIYGIRKDRWEEIRAKCPLEIEGIFISARLKGGEFNWPLWALVHDQQITSPVIEDLL